MTKSINFKTYFIVVLSFFIVLQSNGQVGFKKETLINDIWEGKMRQLHSADLNGDEIDDIVFSVGDGNSLGFIGWFENGGDFEFNNYNTIVENTDEFIKDLHTGDIDGDGDQDIVFSTASQIFWSTNLDGKGSFSDPILIYEDMNLPLLKLADVDIDGDLDIVAIVFYAGDFWFENTSGLGDFLPHEWETSVTKPYVIDVCDVDGDGDIDILYSGDEGWFGWIEDVDGSGNFDIKHEIKGYAARVSPYPTDVDNDGDLDFLLVDPNMRLSWFENIGVGNFGSQIHILDMNGGFAQFMDVNGDSRIDVVTKSTKEIFYNINIGGQLFESTTIPLNLQYPSNITTLRFTYGDYDNDGDYDFCQFINNSPTEYTLAFENQNNTSFEELYKLEYYSQEFKSIEIGDIDGDDDLDFIVEDSDNNKISWYENDGGMSNTWEEHLVSDSTWSTGQIPGSNLSLSDIDGDSDLDIVKNYWDESIYWLENIDGKGNYGGPIHFAELQDGVVNLNSVDIDADGDIDVVAGFEEYILLYINEDGLGTFSEGIEIHQGNRIRALYTADLDGDGLPDVIHETQFDGTFWQKNMSSGQSFSDPILIDENGIGALIRDLDDDGDMDIIKSGINGNEFGWFENDGLGNFTLNISDVTTDENLSVLSTVDIDADGDEDLLVHDPNAFDFGWLENLGQPNGFSDYKFLVANSEKYFYPKSPHMNLDLDGDGDEDFIMARGDQINLYENRSEGNFINGNVKFSNDVNDCEASDYSLKNVLVEATSDFETLTTNTNADGNYTLSAIEGLYTTSIIPIGDNFDSNPGMYVNDFTDLGEVVVNDFCITPNTAINDLAIDIYPLGPPRPGFELGYRIVYTNEGTALMNGQVVFDFDETIISFIESNTTIESQLSNSLTFSFSELFPLESKTINLKFKVGLIPDVMLGDLLTVKASIFPIANDVDPADNENEITQTVVGSYDPNDIKVMEGPHILVSEADNYLHYLIRFQNTGNFPADNVRITNSLDDQLDYRKLVLGESSHPYTMMITDGKDIEFKFDNINLPDSTNNEPESHGFITYKIKPNPDFSLGDIVYNDAKIFFDFNPPIQTNIVSTEVVEALNSKGVSLSKVNIYPNPVDDNVRIDTEEDISSIEIADIFGNTTIIVGDNKIIDFRQFSQGIYFLIVHFENGDFVVRKVIKI